LPELREIYETVNRLAPWDLAETWDNAGLQVGRMDHPVNKIMLAVDLDQKVLAEGIQHRVDGFLVHHPLLFKPVSEINPGVFPGNLIYDLIKHDLFLLAAHTNVDKSAEGINRYLGELFGLTGIRIMEPAGSQLIKVVVFVPEDYLDRLRTVLARAGAGTVGDYSACSFGVSGYGAFIPGPAAKPFIGEPGRPETVNEFRLEMVAERRNLSQIIKAIYHNHPYQEPAFDVYPLLNESRHGLGIIGSLPEPTAFGEFCLTVKEKLQAGGMRVSGDPCRIIRKVALCSGSGKSLLKQAIRTADVFLTADLSYHDFCEAAAAELGIIDAGHWTTEKFFIPWLAEHLKRGYQPEALQLFSSGAIQEEPYRVLR